MAADITRLQGQVVENCEASQLDGDVERLIVGLLRSLLEEQQIGFADSSATSET